MTDHDHSERLKSHVAFNFLGFNTPGSNECILVRLEVELMIGIRTVIAGKPLKRAGPEVLSTIMVR